MAPFNRNAAVRHPRFGPGQVTLDQGDSVVVRFEHGIEECLAADLELVEGLAEQIAAGRLDPRAACRHANPRRVHSFGQRRLGRLFPIPHRPAAAPALGLQAGARIVAHAMAGGGRRGAWQDHRSRPHPHAAAVVGARAPVARSGTRQFGRTVASAAAGNVRHPNLDLRSRRRYGNLRLLEYPRPGNRFGTYVASRQGQSLGSACSTPSPGTSCSSTKPIT